MNKVFRTNSIINLIVHFGSLYFQTKFKVCIVVYIEFENYEGNLH